jgi:hypothetical protein
MHAYLRISDRPRESHVGSYSQIARTPTLHVKGTSVRRKKNERTEEERNNW